MQRDELAERLEAYATAKLAPDPDAMAEIRSNLVARAERVSAPVQTRHGLLGLPFLAGLSRRLHQPARGSGGFAVVRRMGYAAGSCALLLTMATGAYAASGPGGPFYDTRLWLEAVTLPSSGSARANSELVLLEARIKEARDAAARGDANALQAALQAYGRTADDVIKNASPTDRSRLDDELSKHVDVLESLLGKTGGKSTEALQNAIDRAETTIQRIESGSQGNPGNQGGDQGNQGNPGGDQGNQGNPGGDQGNPGNQGNPGGDQSHPTPPPPHDTHGKADH